MSRTRAALFRDAWHRPATLLPRRASRDEPGRPVHAAVFRLGRTSTSAEVRADPFDPHDALVEVHGYDQPIVISFDIDLLPGE